MLAWVRNAGSMQAANVEVAEPKRGQTALMLAGGARDPWTFAELLVRQRRQCQCTRKKKNGAARNGR